MRINDIKQLVSTELEIYETEPRVEVCVFHHSSPEITLKCIQSIIAHTDWPYKLTVLDTSMYPAFMAKIYNRSVMESECDYVAIVCSDAEFKSKWLRKLMDYMLADNTVAIVGPLTTRPPNQKMIDLVEGTGVYVGSWDWISLPILVINKRLFKKVGGYDDRFFLYGHDPDLYRRLDERGYKTCINTNVLAVHEGGSTTKKVFSKEDIVVIEQYNKQYEHRSSSTSI